MGYTNYWHQHNDISDSNWKIIKSEYTNYVQQIAGTKIIDSSTEDTIKFDGGCETFLFSKHAKTIPDYKGQDISLSYCKTRAALYDIFVWYMLTFINKTDPSISISRDV